MSVSVVAAPDGNSAIVKVNGIERLRIKSDGSLEASGSPAAGVRGNVLATMEAFSREFAGLLEGNGYTPLPNGLILQWATGATTTVGDQDQAITFPIAFPTVCLHLSVSTKAISSSLSDSWFQEKSSDRFGCVVVSQWMGGGSMSSGVAPRIIAIGK